MKTWYQMRIDNLIWWEDCMEGGLRLPSSKATWDYDRRVWQEEIWNAGEESHG